MKEYLLENFKGCNWKAKTHDNKIFDIETDVYVKGEFVICRESVTLEYDEMEHFDVNEAMRLLKGIVKAENAREESKFKNTIESFGEDAGTRKKEFSLKNVLYVKIKHLNMNKFINQAIAEKLERDGLM